MNYLKFLKLILADMWSSLENSMKVYLVEDEYLAPGRVYAVFADSEEAEDFREQYHADEAKVVPRTLLYGQHVAVSGYVE